MNLRRPLRIGAILLAPVILALTAAPAMAAAPQSANVQSLTAGYAAIQVKGVVDPGDFDTTWWVETSRDNVSWSGYPGVIGEFAAHTGPHAVETEITDEEGNPEKFLLGATRYYVRIAASNGQSVVYSTTPNPFVTTLAVTPPTVLSTNNATEISYTTAKVSGSVERPANPAATFDAKCGFEYVIHSQFVLTGFKGAARTSCDVNPVTTTGPTAVKAELSGLKPGATYHFRLTASNPGGSQSLPAPSTFTTTAITPPSVTIANPVPGSGTSAHFSGTVNPEEGPGGASLYEVNWHFECTPKCTGPGGEPVSGPPIPPDKSSHPVAADVVLEPNTEYHVRLVASNAGETATSGSVTITTPAFAPVARTLGVSAQVESASLGAKIRPLNAPVVYQFEWGLTDAYGNFAPANPAPVGRADNTYHFVFETLTELSPGTVYHYRVVATNTQTSQETVGDDRTFTTLPTPKSTPACSNETSRVGASANLPDCRAYEFTTPGLNGTGPAAGWPELQVEGVGDDGSMIAFVGGGAPENAEGSTSVLSTLLAQRSSTGWTTKSLSAPTPSGSGTAFGEDNSTVGLSSDLSQSVLWSNQPLAGGSSPSGTNLYLRRADGTFVALTDTGAPKFTAGGHLAGASRDFKRLFIVSTVKQLSSDPVNGGNVYEWSNGSLQLVTILPGVAKEPATGGGHLPEGALPSVSEDGSQVLFKAAGLPGLYLRSDGQNTVEVSETQRNAPPVDPNPTAPAESAGMAADGSQVLFTSSSELTNDANTGLTAGVPNDQGNDLYSYDVGTGDLTDLTVDGNPADAATGADVEAVVGASSDASYVYFIAGGDLAPGATSGERNLYVEHEGAIEFVASDPIGGSGQGYPFYVTPDGLYAAFTSTEGQTGYDNAGHSEVYKFTYGAGLECASCRTSGESPTGNATITGRTLSEDGSRLFFQSNDTVVPLAQSGQSNVFEYEAGEPHLLTPGGGVASVLAGASASGDDVFIATFEELTPRRQGPVFGIYDARVNADVPPVEVPSECQGESCRGAPTVAPQLASPGSAKFEAPGAVAAPKSKTVHGSKTKLRLTVPETGTLSILGRGLKPVKEAASGPVMVTLSLASAADKRRLKKGFFKTNAEILFTSPTGSLSRAEVALKFIAGSKRGKGK